MIWPARTGEIPVKEEKFWMVVLTIVAVVGWIFVIVLSICMG